MLWGLQPAACAALLQSAQEQVKHITFEEMQNAQLPPQNQCQVTVARHVSFRVRPGAVLMLPSHDLGRFFFEKHQFDNFKLKNSDGWYSLRLRDAFRLFELGCLYLEFQ